MSTKNLDNILEDLLGYEAQRKLEAEKDAKRLEEAPHFSKKVIGYRAWVVNHGWILSPAGYQTGRPWNKGTNTAHCGKAPHPAPLHNCTCGLYARHSLDIVNASYAGRGYVIGAIAAWGRIEVHHDGFRAEHAEIVGLAQSGSDANWQLIVDMYEVPLVPMELLAAEAAQHGDPLPKDVIPKQGLPNPGGYRITYPGYVNSSNTYPSYYVTSSSYTNSNMSYPTSSYYTWETRSSDGTTFFIDIPSYLVQDFGRQGFVDSRDGSFISEQQMRERYGLR